MRCDMGSLLHTLLPDASLEVASAGAVSAMGGKGRLTEEDGFACLMTWCRCFTVDPLAEQ